MKLGGGCEREVGYWEGDEDFGVGKPFLRYVCSCSIVSQVVGLLFIYHSILEGTIDFVVVWVFAFDDSPSVTFLLFRWGLLFGAAATSFFFEGPPLLSPPRASFRKSSGGMLRSFTLMLFRFLLIPKRTLWGFTVSTRIYNTFLTPRRTS